MLNPVKISCPSINRLQNTVQKVAAGYYQLKRKFESYHQAARNQVNPDMSEVLNEMAKLARNIEFLQENSNSLEKVRSINFGLRNWGEKNAEALRRANQRLASLGEPTFDCEAIPEVSDE